MVLRRVHEVDARNSARAAAWYEGESINCAQRGAARGSPHRSIACAGRPNLLVSRVDIAACGNLNLGSDL